MTDFEEIIAINAEYAKSYVDTEYSSPIPRKGLAIVTCMDAWIHSAEAFGIRLGDAHIIRNAGGSAKEALRSLLVSQHYLNTNRVIVVKHTGCGMVGITNEEIRATVEKKTGTSADHIDFLPIDELAQAVRDDVLFLRNSGFMSGITITGAILVLENRVLQLRPILVE